MQRFKNPALQNEKLPGAQVFLGCEFKHKMPL